MSNDSTTPEPQLTGSPRSVLAALVFTFITNIDMTTVLTLLPVAIFGGTTVPPLTFSLALSIQVGASLLGSTLVPLLFRGMHAGWMLAISALLKSCGFLALLVTVHEPGLYAFAVLAGFGRGVSKVGSRLLLTNATHEGNRAKVFQLFFITMNVALLIAPLVAQAAVSNDVAQLTLVGLIVLELAGGVWAGVAARRVGSDNQATRKLTVSGGIKLFLRGGPAAVLGYTLIAYFAMGFIMAMFLLYATVNPRLADFRSLFLSFEPLALIVIQLAFMPFWSKLPRSVVYSAAAVTCGAGVLLSFTSSVVLVLAGLALFAFSECLAMPASQVEASKVVAKAQLATMLSLVTILSAVGEIIGNVVAGWIVRNAGGLLPAATASGMAVSVIVLIGFGVASAGILRTTRTGGDAMPDVAAVREGKN